MCVAVALYLTSESGVEGRWGGGELDLERSRERFMRI